MSSVIPMYVEVPDGAAAAAASVSLLVESDKEVFQQWALPTPTDEQEALVSARIRGYNNKPTRRVNYRVCYRHLGLDLDQDSPVEPGRHTDVPATQPESSANVISVKVLHSAAGYPVALYGCVFVRDYLDNKRVYLFRRSRDNPQIVHTQGESLVLTGPSRGLFVCDGLFFEFNLKVRGDHPQLDDTVFSKGMIHYDAVIVNSSNLHERELTSMLSTMELTYAPVERAVEATIEIRVSKAPQECYLPLCPGNEVSSLDDKKDLDKKFYGKITACTSGIQEEILLFDSEVSGTMITVEDDGPFELWRRVISVPLRETLLLRLDTWDDVGKDNFCTCTINFTPEICGKEIADVHSASYMMQVRVAWSALYIQELDADLRSGGLHFFF